MLIELSSMNHVSEAVGRGVLLRRGKGVGVICKTSMQSWREASSEVGTKETCLRALLSEMVMLGFYMTIW